MSVWLPKWKEQKERNLFHAVALNLSGNQILLLCQAWVEKWRGLIRLLTVKRFVERILK
jgi:hypothetical protein